MKSCNLVLVAILAIACNSTLSAQDEGRTFFVKVTKSEQLAGQMIEVSELEMNTDFGDVTIPIDKIEAVKMNAGGDGSAVLAFSNGDMITGTLDLSELHLKTTWGKAHISAAAIDSFSTSQYGRFFTDSSGTGWRYSRGSAPTNSRSNLSPAMPITNQRFQQNR